LLEILLRRDDDLVPLFCKALVETKQEHVARVLGYKGLHTFFAVFITSACGEECCVSSHFKYSVNKCSETILGLH